MAAECRGMAVVERGASPTVLLLDDGSGLDFTEPVKTKRVAVSLLLGTA